MEQRCATFGEVELIVNRLEGQLAWRSRAGSGTGSIFTLQFGPALSSDESTGEFSLMVYCAWRIVKGNTIICTWHGDSDTILVPALKSLENDWVTKATLSKWGDLTVNFKEGYALQIWNDAPFTGTDSWSIGHKGSGFYAVEPAQGFVYELSGQ